jgi:F0F1-type ATP synthase assembly protein I
MIRRIGIAIGGAAIGGVLGWTIAAFTGWTPAVAIVALLFGVLAMVNEEREHGTAADDRDRPTRLFPPDDNA